MVASPTIVVGIIVEQCRRDEERDQDMAHLKMQMDLLTKHVLSGKTKKVKVVELHDRVDADADEEANYVNNQGGF